MRRRRQGRRPVLSEIYFSSSLLFNILNPIRPACRKGVPRRGLVRKLDPLARPGEYYRVVADYVAGAYGLYAYLLRPPLAYYALPLVDSHLLEVPFDSVGRDLRDLQGSARGRVLLVPVVRLDYLHVVLVAHDARRVVHELQKEVDAYGHVGRHHYPRVL